MIPIRSWVGLHRSRRESRADLAAGMSRRVMLGETRTGGFKVVFRVFGRLGSDEGRRTTPLPMMNTGS
jgi:hypothetical protein